MAVVDEKSGSDGKGWSLCSKPFWQNGNASSSASPPPSASISTFNAHLQSNGNKSAEPSSSSSSGMVSAIAKSLLPSRKRLRLDPSNKLYFPYEPGKQVKSAIEIKNTSKNHVAFKFQTTAPKSCYMRPPGGILAPGESIIATVFKFVEPPENNEKPSERRRVKFKIVSLKVKGGTDYVPELFDEQKDQVAVEQILQVVFLDPENSNPALEKLFRQLSVAETASETRQKPAEETGPPKVAGEGLVIDEWKERRERYLAKQQVGGVNSV